MQRQRGGEGPRAGGHGLQPDDAPTGGHGPAQQSEAHQGGPWSGRAQAPQPHCWPQPRSKLTTASGCSPQLPQHLGQQQLRVRRSTRVVCEVDSPRAMLAVCKQLGDNRLWGRCNFRPSADRIGCCRCCRRLASVAWAPCLQPWRPWRPAPAYTRPCRRWNSRLRSCSTSGLYPAGSGRGAGASLRAVAPSAASGASDDERTAALEGLLLLLHT